jgi:hypothetical protein
MKKFISGMITALTQKKTAALEQGDCLLYRFGFK